ncbi:MAG: DnaJ domain-containing protein [Candidatus Omnitrophica bacterium]|nr:DnaJ domain-containing protein [Candidatus Omnitrophota bacterium]
MADFKQIDQARQILGLEQDATMEEIKVSYRDLAHKYHPDRCSDEKKKECEEMFKKISHANDILMAYCAGYRYSFEEKDVKRNTMDRQAYKHLKRFFDGWWDDLDF